MSDIVDTGTLVRLEFEGPYTPLATWRNEHPEPYCTVNAVRMRDGEEETVQLMLLDVDELDELLVGANAMRSALCRELDARDREMCEAETLAEHDRKESERTW